MAPSGDLRLPDILGLAALIERAIEAGAGAAWTPRTQRCSSGCC